MKSVNFEKSLLRSLFYL